MTDRHTTRRLCNGRAFLSFYTSWPGTGDHSSVCMGTATSWASLRRRNCAPWK